MPSIEGEVVKTKRIEGEPVLPIGLTPDIQVGVVSTLNPDMDAFVVLDEESSRLTPKFNFGIPRGKDGINGKDGQNGQNGVDGKDGADGVDGKDGIDGKDYVITEQDYVSISEIVKNDIQPILDEVKTNSETAISISKGANQALSYLTYIDMITNFNAFDKNKFEKSQSVMIKQLNVPDMWIYDLSDEHVEYTYTTDEAIINALMSDAGLHVGYYILGPLETQKVDLTDYIKNTDYANATNAGAVKINSNFGITIRADGIIMPAGPSKSELNDRTNTVRPLTPHVVDYAVKKALSDCKLSENDVWTEEEKTNARVLINAISDTDYASSSKGGTIKPSNTYGVSVNTSGGLICDNRTYDSYKTSTTGLFVSKGTLDAVLNGRFVTLTQGAYDELLAAGNIDADTEYNIVEE